MKGQQSFFILLTPPIKNGLVARSIAVPCSSEVFHTEDLLVGHKYNKPNKKIHFPCVLRILYKSTRPNSNIII